MSKRVFFVGAGASLPAPASLPLFGELRRVLCEWMGVDVRLTRDLPPEVFMHCVARSGAPLASWIKGVLGVGRPNAVHAVLAQEIMSGSTVWCLNVDELIESQLLHLGCPDVKSVRATRNQSPDSSARLLKPHGTTSLENFIFQSGQVIRPLPASWAERLTADFRDADQIIFIGYRGADIDLRAPLNDALMMARPNSVLWFACSKEEWSAAVRWLPALGRFGLSALRTYENPSDAFVQTIGESDLMGRLTTDQRSGLSNVIARPVFQPSWHPSHARALLLERLSQEALAEDAFLANVLRVRHPLSSIVRYAKMRWYAGDRRFGVLRYIDSSRLGHLALGPLARKVRRANIMYLSSELGDHDRAVVLADRSSRSDPATWIVLAKGRRYEGDLPGALDAADRASKLAAPERARKKSRVDEKAHATFEQVYANVWMGRFGHARSLLVDLYEGFDQQANVRWSGWAKYLHAGLELLDGKASADVELELDNAITYFDSDDGRARRRSECRMLRAAIQRFREVDVTWLASEVFDEDRPAFAQLERTRQFELGEIARSRGDFVAAIENYAAARCRQRPYVHVAALLGGVEARLARGSEEWRDDLEEAKRTAVSCSLGHLQVHAIITSCRAGEIDEARAVQNLQQIGECIPGWILARPSGGADLLSRRVEHPIFCLW